MGWVQAALGHRHPEPPGGVTDRLQEQDFVASIWDHGNSYDSAAYAMFNSAF